MSGAYLRAEGLAVGYQGKALIQHIALSLRRGEIMTLIGPNGSGKSTILRSVIGQLRLIGGTVYLDGRAMAGMSEVEIAKRLSVLMTDRVRPEMMTCEDVVSTGRYPYTGRLGLLNRTFPASAMGSVSACCSRGPSVRNRRLSFWMNPPPSSISGISWNYWLF